MGDFKCFFCHVRPVQALFYFYVAWPFSFMLQEISLLKMSSTSHVKTYHDTFKKRLLFKEEPKTSMLIVGTCFFLITFYFMCKSIILGNICATFMFYLLFSKVFITFYLVYVHVCVSWWTCRDQRYPVGIDSLFPPCGFWALNTGVRLGVRHLSVLIHQSLPLCFKELCAVQSK